MRVNTDGTPRTELFVALDCGTPIMEFEPLPKLNAIRVFIHAYRTARVKKRDCTYAVVGARVPIRDFLWRPPRMMGSEQSTAAEITRTAQGTSILFDFPEKPKSNGTLSFILEGGLTQIGSERFRVDVTLGHYPAHELTKEVRNWFREITPSSLQFSILAPKGYSLEMSFPDARGGRSHENGLIYDFMLPYAYSPLEYNSGNIDYYEQSDLSATFLNASNQERKSYMAIIWSTLLGLGIGLFVDGLFRLYERRATNDLSPDKTVSNQKA